MFLSLFLLIWRGGGSESARQMGACPMTQPAILRAFWRATSDPTRGGGHKQTNPLPPGCNHHRNLHHARSYRIKISSLSIQSSAQFMCTLGGRRAIRRGGGVGMAEINPPPPRLRSPSQRPSRALQHICLKVQSWPRATSHAPPMRAHRTHPGHVLCSVIF
jgi:hypothetical protein